MKNINSLKGEHFIDFNSQPLEGAPMFLITGPTGSGKTTILDAITAALFDRTPRLNSKTTRALKSQTAETAFIELNYIVKGDEYKNIWQIDKRDNKKISIFKNGELLAPVKLNSLASKTLEIIGSDYDTFVKTIILAQNRFDEFIKSSPEDRRKIIESITDNKTLEKIKIAIRQEYEVFGQKYGELRQKLSMLETIIGESDIKSLETAFSEKIELVSLEKGKAAEASKKKAALENLKEISGELARKEKSLRELNAGYDFNAAASEINALKAVRDRYASIITDIKNREAALEEKRSRREREAETLAALLSRHETAAAAREKAALELSAFNEGYAAKIADIATVKSLYNSLGEAVKNYEAALKKSQTANNARTKAEAARDAVSKRIKAAEAEKEILINKNQQYSIKFEDGESALFEFKSDIEKLKNLKADIEKFAAEIKKNETAASAASARCAEIKKRLDSFAAEIKELDIKRAESEASRLRLEKDFEEASVSSAVVALRSSLAEGAKCPVCGSVDHPDAKIPAPAAIDALKIKAAMKAEEVKIKQIALRAAELEKNAAADKAALGEITADLNAKTAGGLILNEEFNEKISAAKMLEKTLAASSPFETGDFEKAAAEWAEALKFMAAQKEALGKLETAIEIDKNNYKNACDNIDILKGSETEAASAAARLKENKDSIEAEIGRKGGNVNPLDAERRLEELKTALNEKYSAAESAFNSINSLKESKKHLIENFDAEISGALASLAAARERFESALQAGAFTAEAALEGYKKLGSLNIMETEYNEKLSLKNNIEARTGELKSFIGGRNFNENDLETAREEERSAAARLETLNREAGEIEAQIKKQSSLIKEYESLKAEHKKNSEEHEVLEKLYLTTKDNQFRDFVLSFYLKNLLLLANQYLKVLTAGRYELLFDLNSANAIFIKDYFNEGREREINTVSGGEAFMASLSLALGLSQVSAGDARIEFMFLDEGFGVLDADALEDVLDMISRLDNIGRKIGIISHIQQVKDRIETRIELIKNNDGSSNIKIY